MKKFFINNGSGLTLILCLIFFVMTDLTGDYLPKFSSTFLTGITYFIIVLLPVSLSIYYKNKKWKKAFENISWGIFIVCVIYYGLVEYEIIFPP